MGETKARRYDKGGMLFHGAIAMLVIMIWQIAARAG